MHKIINFVIISLLLSSNLFAENYIATRQELWFSDSSYYKTSHHVKIGKKIKMENYSLFGELGVGEDINEGTPVGSGQSFDYLRFGATKTFFNALKVDINYRSKMKAHDRDLNWIVINTKYKF
jgi:hypothetical protein